MTLLNVKESVHEDFRKQINGLKDKFRKRQSEQHEYTGKANRFSQLIKKIVSSTARSRSRVHGRPFKRKTTKSWNASPKGREPHDRSLLIETAQLKEKIKKTKTIGGSRALKRRTSASANTFQFGLKTKAQSPQSHHLTSKNKPQITLPVQQPQE